MIKYVEMKYNKKILRGTVHIPETKEQNFQTVIMFHGFGANRLEHYGLFVKMSEAFMQQGIASIRFDFSGHGESDGDFSDVTLSNEVNEGCAILEYAKTLDFVDNTKICLLGMSFGGVVASLVASMCQVDVLKLCMWAPAAVAIDEININKTLQGRSLSEIETKGYLDFNSYKVTNKLVKDVKDFNLYEKAKNFKKEVKIIHGDQDNIAPISYSETYLKHYGDNAELFVLKGATHSFSTVELRETLFKETLKFLALD